jgi:hypothetical protein
MVPAARRRSVRYFQPEGQMPARKRTRSRTGARKYGKAATKRVASAMRRRKRGTLKSSSGAKVKSRKQAIAIGLSEARSKGAKVPRKKK